MVDIGDEVLTTLKCSECDNYLSCSPIMVKENGDSVCGRCSVRPVSEHYLIRIKAYENLARIVKFPCRFHKDGCRKKLSMDEIIDHEEDCEYRNYSCPVLPIRSCNWIGTRSEIYQHFKVKHVDLIFRATEQPLQFKYDNTNAEEKNIIVVVFDFVFLLQIRTNASTIFQRVLFIGPSKFASQFKYLLTVTKKQYKLMVEETVSQLKNYNENNEQCIILSVIELNAILGPLEDTTLSLLITRSELKCMKCDDTITQSTKYDHLQEAKYCDDCHSDETDNEFQIEKGIFCSHRNEGCTFEGNEIIDLQKHSYWFCNYEANTCQFCNRYLKPDTRGEHFKKCDKLTSQYSNTAVSEIVCAQSNFLQVEIHDELFYCTVYVKGKYLWIYVVSQSATEKLDKFEIELTMELDKIKYKKHKLKKITDTDSHYDWREKFVVNNNGPYNIKIHIKKNK